LLAVEEDALQLPEEFQFQLPDAIPGHSPEQLGIYGALVASS
jgi:hypothetical protein